MMFCASLTPMCRWFVMVFAVAVLSASVSQAEDVDVELVLAVDDSGSVDAAEYALQIAGYAEAFRDPSIQAAITSGPLGKIAAAMVIWGDAALPKHTTRWYLLDSAAAAESFANDLTLLGKRTRAAGGFGGGGTGIGDAVRHAIEMMSQNRHRGVRRVVDVTGDGPETPPWFRKAMMMPEAKVMAGQHRVTINGLAILSDFADLDVWYRDNVIYGPGSFVLHADSFETFAQAIRRKLWLELAQQIAQSALPGVSVP
ncbi:MAG: DUF1194 domain-containing protein [Paracoccaceae bacterium]